MLAFWQPTIKDFQGKDVIETDALPAITVFASREDYSAAGATVALDPARYACVTEHPLALSDGKGWWDGNKTAPIRVSPDLRDCWVSPITGLKVPTGTKSLLLTFAPSKPKPNIAEIQAFSGYDRRLRPRSRHGAPGGSRLRCLSTIRAGPWWNYPGNPLPPPSLPIMSCSAADSKFSRDLQTMPLPPCSTHFLNYRLAHDSSLMQPLPPNTEYYYRVGARKPDGTLIWGNNTVGVRTAAPDPSWPAPASLTAADAGSTVALEWPAVPKATGYKLELRER